MLFAFLLAFFSPQKEIVVNVSAYGAIPNDGIDDTSAFEAALAELNQLNIDNSKQPVLKIDHGKFILENKNNRKWSLRITQPVILRGASSIVEYDENGVVVSGTLIEGDLSPGDTNEPPTDWSSKDIIFFSVDTRLTDLLNVGVEHLSINFARTWAGNEQAHAIVVSGEDPLYVRHSTFNDLVIGPVGNGDCIYFGSNTSDITVTNLTCFDQARGGIVLAGASSPDIERNNINIQNVVGYHTGFNPAQETGPIIDFEPRADVWFRNVNIKSVSAPLQSMHISHIIDGTINDAVVRKVSSGSLFGVEYNRLTMSCSAGDGGDGRGYCYSHFRPPTVFTINDGVFDVNPDGQGIFYIRDYRGLEGINKELYNVTINGRGRLNGGVVLRPDLLTDELLVDIDIKILD